MWKTFNKIVKDIATLANGEDFCAAGISMLIAIAIGIFIFAYVVAIIKPHAIGDITSFMQAYSVYNGSVVTTGGVGKMLTNKSEPDKG